MSQTPLLPIQEWIRWGEDLSAATVRDSGDGEAQLQAAVAADRIVLLDRLSAVMEQPEVRQALFLTAPDVDRQRQLTLNHEPDAGLRRTLVRYFLTMTGSVMPSGMLAGCSLGRVGASSKLRMSSIARCRTFTTIDVAFLHAATERLKHVAATDPRLRVRTNPTIYQAGDHLRYIVAVTEHGNSARRYEPRTVETTAAISATLDRAAGGATLADLAEAVRSLGLVTDDNEATAFVGTLLSCQLLVGGIDPSVTGPEPLVDVMGRLGRLQTPGLTQLCQVLATVEQSLRDLDRGGLGHAPSRYQDLLPALRTINPDSTSARCLVANLYKPAPEAVLGQHVTAAIAGAVRLLHKISPYPVPPTLIRFRDRFATRYGARDVALLEALDADLGVGFESIDLNDETNAARSSASTALNFRLAGATEWTRRDEHLIKRLRATVAAGERVLFLHDSDMDALQIGPHAPLPDGFAARVTLAAPSEAALHSGQFELLLHGIIGPSGAECFGRFCHGNPDLTVAIRNWFARQDTSGSGAIPAEIVHDPHPRHGNLVCRPHLRRHEILCLGQPDPTADSTYQIPVSDLTIRLADGRLILRSRALARDVAPKLSAVHDPSVTDPAVYRCLSALQRQDASALSWDWGALSELPFLPRVTAGRVVLCRATWHLDERDLAPLRTAVRHGADTLSQAFSAVSELRRRHHIPKHVNLIERDKTLLLDLDNVLCTDILAAAAADAESVTLAEWFPSVGQLCATSPQGHFVHELLLPFQNPEQNRRSAASSRGR